MLSYDDIPTRFNLTSWFLDRNVEAGNADHVALICDRADYGVVRVTYGELARLTNRVGHVLRDLGVRREDRVLLALGDGVEFVAGWYGALKVGAVVAEVYTFLQPRDYAYYLDYARPRVVIADSTTLDNLRTALGEVGEEPRLLVVGARELRPGEIAFEAAVEQASDELDPADTTKDDLALWKFTTGTTGASKAAVHPQHDPLVSFECYARGVVRYEPDDVVLPVPKLFFGYARDTTALFTFGVGAAGLVFPERSTPGRLFELIDRHRPTVLVQVPTMMSAMLDHPGADSHDLGCLRCCISSGEALPEEVHRRWLDVFGVEVLEGIGSSELYHIYISNRPGQVRPGRFEM